MEHSNQNPYDIRGMAIGEDNIISNEDDNIKLSNVHEMKRELSLLDLTSIGIGGIVGAGIYVLSGQAAFLTSNATNCVVFLTLVLPRKKLPKIFIASLYASVSIAF